MQHSHFEKLTFERGEHTGGESRVTNRTTRQ